MTELSGGRTRLVRQQLRRYAGAVRWLVAKLWATFRWRVVRAVAAAQVGVVVIGAGLGLSVHYAQRLEEGGELAFGGVALAARDEQTLLLAVAAVLGVLLAGGGILFAAQRSIVAMAAELNHRVRTDIALSYGGELPEADDWRDDRAVARALWVLQTRDARRSAIVTRSLLRNSVNVGVAVVGVGALFYLEPGLTLLLCAVMAVGLIAYYWANAFSVRATRRYEAIAPTTRRQLHRLLPSFQTLPQPALARDGFDDALGRDDTAEEVGAFRDRFGAHIYAELLNFAIMGVVLAGLIGYMGREALIGAMPWTRLVAYMVVLRITMGGVHSIFTTFAFFSRFYPSIERLHRFFAASTTIASGGRCGELWLRGADTATAEDDAARKPVVPGEVVEVVLPVALSRYSLGLLAPLLGGDPAGRRRLLGQIALAVPLSPPPTAASLRDLLGLDDDWDADTLRAHLGDQADAVADAVGLDPRATVPAAAWARLPEPAAARLVVAAAAASDRPVLAIDRGLAAREGAERLRAVADHKVVLVCGRGVAAGAADLGVTRTVVASRTGAALAVGSPEWVAARWDAVAEQPVEPGPAEASADDDFDEE